MNLTGLSCCCSVTQLCLTLRNPMDAHQASLSFTTSQSLLKLMSIKSTMPSKHLILCRPILLMLSVFPSIRVFSSESDLLIRWPKYWASASILPMHIQGWFPLGCTGWISLQSKGLSRVFSSTTVQKHQFFGAQASLWSRCHTCTWLLEKPWLWLCGILSGMWCLCFLICLGLSWLFFQRAGVF